MQEQVKEQLATIRVEVSTGGGMVTVRMNGARQVTGIVIEPEATEDIEMLQDMVRAAVNEAAKRVEEEAQAKIGGVMGGMRLTAGLFR